MSETLSDGSEAKLSEEYSQMLAALRTAFDSGRTKDIEWRRRQLQNLIKGIQENHEAIQAAIDADLGGPKIRAIADMAPIVGDAEHALANLDRWAKPQVMKNDLIIDVQSTFQVRPEPKGVTLNIAPWNFPFNMCFQPLVPALAAGNCMVVKPSEIAHNSSEVIQKIIDGYLDNDCVKCVRGAVPETTALLAQRWDHIFYTGNGAVGRTVMQAAAKHLTPVTLELGGKSPAIVDKTANMNTVVNRVFAAKSLNQGQVCVSPDFVLIDESREEEFLDMFSKQVAASNFGAGSKENPDWGKIINERHANRLKELIETSGGKVVCGGADDIDVAAKHTPVTLELGGKSPVFIDKTADMKAVVNRLFFAKSLNQGQACVAPDYVLIDESRETEFVDMFNKQVAASNFGAGSKDNPNWGKIIDGKHTNRLKHLIETCGGNVVCGGADDVDVEAQHVPISVLQNVNLDAPVMQQEVFGPILPVIPLKNIDDGIRLIKERERPLALYVFSQDKHFQERVLRECPSGGACVNSAFEHLANKEAPFGGTGSSGIGRYHGKFGFDEFSHYRTILYKRGSAAFIPPVEQLPKWLYDVALKLTVTGFLKPSTKRKLRLAALSFGVLIVAAVLRRLC
eukprot:CAMPEP_0172784878 /NCGR_PEP_ID=MMETSP1074-20121228/205162_1 /TAXON_ID=2916 /ORGANISM="Ceratium fusus, Strain PA161109" /LENGTH=623 /DNA_ID=CAMNT_0013621883 /DNA_START=5 /DNA_END=1876 /DNA_ORIENTATION=+